MLKPISRVAALLALFALCGFLPSSFQTAQVIKTAKVSLGSTINTPVTIYTSPSSATFTAAIAGNLMTVSAVATGTLSIGMNVSGGTNQAVITGLGTGTGNTGSYYVSVPQTVTSTTLNAFGTGSKIIGCTISSSDTANPHVITANIGGLPQSSFTVPSPPTGGNTFASVPCFSTPGWYGLPADSSGNPYTALMPGEAMTIQFITAIGTGNLYATVYVAE